MKDYYSVLGLTYPSTKSEIKKTYRRLSKVFHPDMNGGANFYEACFKEIKEAYDALISAPNSVSEELVESSTSKIKYFYSNARTVSTGETIKLSWSTQHCKDIQINAFGAVPPMGSIEIQINQPSEEYTIELSAVTNDGEPLSQFIYLSVIGDQEFSVKGKPSTENQVDMSSVSAKSSKKRHRMLVPAAGIGLIMVFALGTSYSYFNSIGQNQQANLQPQITNEVVIAEATTPVAKPEIPQETFAMTATLVSNKENTVYPIQKKEILPVTEKKETQPVLEKKMNKKPLKPIKTTTPKPTIKQQPVTKTLPRVTHFKKGSTLKEVLAVQGVPSSMNRAGGKVILKFGKSQILLEKGVVIAIYDKGNLKFKGNSNHTTSNNHFKIGSSKQLVLRLQGQPSTVKRLGDYELLQYGSSVVSIVDGKVSGYTNTSRNLKVI